MIPYPTGARPSIDPAEGRANNPAVEPRLRISSPRTVVLATALAWAAILAGVAHLRWENDPRAFLALGTRFERPASFEGIPRIGPYGYDGQFYAVLATDPLLRHPETLESLDTPGYRATRIGLPLLAWTLSLGHPGTAIVFYQLLCWGLAVAGVGLLAVWLKEEGHSPWWALPAGVSAGVAVTMLRSLVDGAAGAVMLAALMAQRRRQTTPCVAALVFAALIRETSLLAAAAVAATELRRRRWLPALVTLGLPATAFVLWRGFLFWRVGGDVGAGMGNFALPFAWVPEVLAAISRNPRLWSDPEFWGAVGLGLGILGFLAGLRRWLTGDAAGLTFGLFSMLALTLSGLVYVEVNAYARVLLLLPLISLPLALGDRVVWRRALLLSSVAAWAFSGILLVLTELHTAWWSSEPVIRRDFPVHALPEEFREVEDRVAFVAPAAHTPGRDGVFWQTDLELSNPNPFPIELRLEFLGHSGARSNPAPETVALTAREYRTLEDAVSALFGASGAGILTVQGPGHPWQVRSVTRSADTPAAPGFLPSLSRENLLRSGEVKLLDISLQKPTPSRINVGAANLGSTPATVEIRLSGGLLEPRRLRLELPPQAFRQHTDVLTIDSGGPAAGATLEVEVLSPGGEVLVVASLVGPERGAARHISLR